MTPEQVDLIRKSFDALWPVRRRLAEDFTAGSSSSRRMRDGYSPTIWNGNNSS